jgi:hypothetical protein
MGKPAPREADRRAMDVLRAMQWVAVSLPYHVLADTSRDALAREPLRSLERDGQDLRLERILESAAAGDALVLSAWAAFVNVCPPPAPLT